MSLYHRGTEIREFADALYAAWVAAENPKALDWQPLPAQPVHDPQTHTARWDGAQWVVEALPPAPVPDEVDSLSFELVLHDMGAHSAVMAYVATLSERDQIYWWRRKTMRRDSSLIEAGRVALGWSQAQVDALFVAAGHVVT